MKNVSRRTFVRYSAWLAASMGLEKALAPGLAQALEKLARQDVPVLWLQGQSCSGCSVSLLNSTNPGPFELITQYISLKFHSTLSAATGDECVNIIRTVSETKNFVLIVEGAIPAKMPEACVLGHIPFADVMLEAARAAKAVIALGACAASGGIPAAENNPTGATSVPAFLSAKGVKVPLINLPGCPPHPEWMVGTIAHLVGFGVPELDKECRPVMFYSRCVHDICPRFPDYERLKFAKVFGDSGCLFKLGCLGPITNGDCTLRHWNSGANTCLKAGAPCIGCTSPEFALKANLPFYRLNPLFRESANTTEDES